MPDAQVLLAAAARGGFLSAVEERWLADWLDRLDPAQDGAERCFLHGDVQASNVMASATPGGISHVAILDWGGCGWADPARDFAGIPLRAVPALLRGYEAAGRRVDVGLRARIVRRHLQLALFNLGRGPQPGLSWAERQASMLVDVLRFFARPPEGWEELAPPA